MKKFPKLVQCDARGQIVIPKEIRKSLEIEEGSGFYMFTIQDEGILLKKIPKEIIDADDSMLKEIAEKSEKLGIDKGHLKKTVKHYNKKEEEGFEEI